jgi:transposase-like protein
VSGEGAQTARPDDEVVCPHCNKPFSADLLGGATERHRGFKCPHCRLFVPAERAGS